MISLDASSDDESDIFKSIEEAIILFNPDVVLIDCLYIVNVMRPLENHLFELLMLVLPLVWLWTVLLSTNDGHARTKRRDT